MIVCLILVCSCKENRELKKPNILFILVDDQSPFDLKVYDSTSVLQTPNIDALAEEGMVFDGAYHMGSWQGSVCAPSRHMIMSGRSVWHVPDHEIISRNPVSADSNKVPHNLAKFSMPAIFNKAGYETMRTCKVNNSNEATNKLFNIQNDKTNRGAADEEGSAWHAKQVIDYLNERNKTIEKDPFLIYLGFSHPHDPRNGTPELLKKYGATNHINPDNPPVPDSDNPAPPLPVNYLSAHPFHHGHPALRDEERVSGVWKRRDESTVRNEIGRQYACSEKIDIQIGKVLKRLKEIGELENTIIFYTSDHGIAVGRHGLMGKQNLYEHSWRVPFIVKGPGIKKGRVLGNIYLSDVLSTMCDLAGLRPSATVEGTSFVPVLKGKEKVIRNVMYGVYCGGTKPGIRSIRKGDWKLIKYDVLDGQVQKTQLFNLKDNPYELLKEHNSQEIIALTGKEPEQNQINLAENPGFSEKLNEMENLLLEEMQRFDDPYRFWNQID